MSKNELQKDPLAVFAASEAETEGVMVDVEHPVTGELLMRWKIARFGGQNNAQIIREERKLKGKLTQGQRRAIDAGSADPEIVQRLNRQVFVRVSCLGWELVHPALKERYGDFSHEAADKILEAYPRMYDQLSEQAMEEQNYASDVLEEQTGN